MKCHIAIALLLLSGCAPAVCAQAQIDPKELKKSGQVPLLQRDNSAQQLYQRMMAAEDERGLTSDFLNYLTGQHAGVRRRAALSVGRIADRAFIDPLSTVLIDDSNPKVREYAAFALGETEDPKAVRALVSSLLNTGEAFEVRARAAEALGKIVSLLDANVAAEAETIDRINNILINLLPKSPTAQLKPGEDQLVRLSLTALMRIHSVKAIDPVAAVLAFKETNVRFTAANALARILAANAGKASKDSINAAIAALKDESPLVRAAAARALGAAKSSDAVEPLLAILHDSDEQVQVNVIRALGGLDDKRAVAPLIALGQQLLTKYQAAKDPLAPELNRLYVIATALGQLKDKSALPLLKALRPLPGRTIGGNPETEVAIAKFGPDTFFEYEAAQELKAGDWQAVANFATGLGETGGERALKTVDELFAGKRGGTLDVRAIPELLRAMAKLKHPNLSAILREQLAQGRDEIVRATAAELLTGSTSEEDFNAFVAAYGRTDKDTMNDTKLAILTAIAKSGRPQASTTLISALKDNDYLVRRHAADLLRMINAGNFDSSVGRVKTNRDKKFYSDVAALTETSKPIIAELVTTKGTIRMELFADDAPLTVHNFITLANNGYYNNVAFHRVVANFVVQAGDPRGDGNGGPGYQIRCEVNMRPYLRGTVGMALSGKDTGGSQFFICHSPQPHLDGGYTVFGQVTSGMDVVDKITRGDKIEKVNIIE